MNVNRETFVRTGWVGRIFTAVWFLAYAFQAIKPVSVGWLELFAVIAGVALLVGV